MVPNAVVEGNNNSGIIRRSKPNMNNVCSTVPPASCANGVAWCGTNGPIPTICGCNSLIKSKSSASSSGVWYGLPTINPVPTW